LHYNQIEWIILVVYFVDNWLVVDDVVR